MKTKRRLSLLLLFLLLLSCLTACMPTAPADTTTAATTTTAPPPPPPVSGVLEVSFLDVGQADCILLRNEDKTVLIDTGYKKQEVTEKIITYLEALGIERIDYLVLTHPHADHIGGAPDIINAFTVENCLMPNAVATTKIFEDTLTALDERQVNVIEAVAGNTITLGGMTMKILAPRDKTYQETNDYSVVLQVLFGDTSLLLTGDAELLSENEMLETFGAAALKADLLKMGHHGSTTSGGSAFLDAVDPDFAVIMVGDGNSYGHPHDEIIAELETREIPTYRTDINGNIVFTSDGTTLSLTSTEK